MKYYIGIDLGGTNIVAGIVDDDYNILAKASTPTNCPRDAVSIADDMAVVAKAAVKACNLTMEDIEWVGIGAPGTVNPQTGIIEYSNNIEFYNVPMVEYIKERLGKPIYIANDANAAGLGETLAGAAKGAKHAVVVTLGTGVGSGVVIDGKVYSGFNFAGCELGHIVLEYDGRLCTCGRKGCFEAYASATGLINITKEAMLENPTSTMWDICENDIEKVNGKTSFDGMRRGDRVGMEVVDKYISYLACGISNIINALQPEIICIGGGICKEGDTLIAPLSFKVSEQIFSRNTEKNTKIVVAKLGNNAGIIGAAMLGR